MFTHRGTLGVSICINAISISRIMEGMSTHNCRVGRKHLRVEGKRVETASLDISPCNGKCEMYPVIGFPAEICKHCHRTT